MKTLSKLLTSSFTAVVMFLMTAAHNTWAGPVLVHEFPWGYDYSDNMNAVFGAGNYTAYTSYASATPSLIFTSSNEFVMLEGGANTDVNLASYLASNGTDILNWVMAGGALLIQSAGWYTDISFNGVTLTLQPAYYNANSCGTLTAVGQAAFPGTAVNQCGTYLAHDVVAGTGLTDFMLGDDTGTPIIAGMALGAGYVMYSGLTASRWHSRGPSLVNEVIRYTAQQAQQHAVPVPPSLALLGIGLVGLAAVRRKGKPAA